MSGTNLAALEDTRLDAERLSSNIENMIGAVEVPVGIAGPLLFRGQEARGMIYAPMATTEGALVASVTRGATAITRAGGSMPSWRAMATSCEGRLMGPSLS